MRRDAIGLAMWKEGMRMTGWNILKWKVVPMSIPKEDGWGPEEGHRMKRTWQTSCAYLCNLARCHQVTKADPCNMEPAFQNKDSDDAKNSTIFFIYN